MNRGLNLLSCLTFSRNSWNSSSAFHAYRVPMVYQNNSRDLSEEREKLARYIGGNVPFLFYSKECSREGSLFANRMRTTFRNDASIKSIYTSLRNFHYLGNCFQVLRFFESAPFYFSWFSYFFFLRQRLIYRYFFWYLSFLLFFSFIMILSILFFEFEIETIDLNKYINWFK